MAELRANRGIIYRMNLNDFNSVGKICVIRTHKSKPNYLLYEMHLKYDDPEWIKLGK